MVHVQNSTLAGGVAIGTAAGNDTRPTWTIDIHKAFEVSVRIILKRFLRNDVSAYRCTGYRMRCRSSQRSWIQVLNGKFRQVVLRKY